MASTTVYKKISGRNTIAGVHNQGTFTVNNYDGPREPPLCRLLPFPRNLEFVERPDVARELERLLPPSSGYHSAALWGLGGSGKTQIALQYAHNRCADPKCSTFWVHADSETSFSQDYKAIAARLDLPKELEGEDLLQAVRHAIEANPNWVLVLDNADNLSLFGIQPTAQHAAQALNLSDYLPRGATGTVLWTSRDRQAGSLVGRQRAIHVDHMTSPEAETLLQMGRNKPSDADDSKAIQMLLAELGRLPLAISQAAAYMYRTSTPIEQYLSEIQERGKRQKALQRSEHDRHRRPEVSNSILKTWDISIDYLQRENELTFNIMHILAYTDNQHISKRLIQKASKYRHQLDTQLQRRGGNSYSSSGAEDSGGNNESVADAITRLCEFSFLNIRELGPSPSQRAYKMHKLVQEAARYRLEKDQAAYFAQAAFEVVNSLFPDSQRETWPECEEYLVHVQHAGEWAALYKGEEKVAALLTRVSNYLYKRGRWREKEPVDKTALSLRTKVLGEKHPDTIKSMAELATTYHQQGRYDEAEKIYLEVLGLRREVLGDKHPDTISSMADFAASSRDRTSKSKPKRKCWLCVTRS